MTGWSLLREIGAHDPSVEVAGFVDDDPRMRFRSIEGAPVLGTGDDLARLVELHAIDEVRAAIPSATLEQRARIAECVARTGLALRWVGRVRGWTDGRRDEDPNLAEDRAREYATPAVPRA
jgi:FlaA1/EpsC-like NDP-sugar epimerase